jgi:hypothetical protein
MQEGNQRLAEGCERWLPALGSDVVVIVRKRRAITLVEMGSGMTRKIVRFLWLPFGRCGPVSCAHQREWHSPDPHEPLVQPEALWLLSKVQRSFLPGRRVGQPRLRRRRFVPMRRQYCRATCRRLG